MSYPHLQLRLDGRKVVKLKVGIINPNTENEN